MPLKIFQQLLCPKTKTHVLLFAIISVSVLLSVPGCRPKPNTAALKSTDSPTIAADTKTHVNTNAGTNTAQPTPSNNENNYVTTSSGKKIRKAELGVTIVNPDGWSESDMNFHLSYCAQMFANMPEVDAGKFCPCFLEKIQYYYEPIFFKEAYEHQQKWNTECYELAKKK